MRSALWVLLYSDYLRRGYLTIIHIEIFIELRGATQQRCQVDSMALELPGGERSGSLCTSNKSNTMWAFEEASGIKRKTVFAATFCSKKGEMFDVPFPISEVGCWREMVWLKYIQQPLSKAAWSSSTRLPWALWRGPGQPAVVPAPWHLRSSWSSVDARPSLVSS